MLPDLRKSQAKRSVDIFPPFALMGLKANGLISQNENFIYSAGIKMILNRLVFLFIISVTSLLGCSAQSLIITSPPRAEVMLDNKPLENNTLHYGRWVGNSYDLQVSSPGFITQKLKLSPHLGNRSSLISVFCLATLVGIPFLPSVYWNGELDEKIYITLENVITQK